MGQKYASYNSSGAIIAFYDSVDSPPPKTAIVLAITDQEWQTCIGTPGYTVVSGTLTPPPAPTAGELFAQAQATQIGILKASFNTAMTAPVTVTLSSGNTYTFATDAQSLTNLNEAISANIQNGTWAPNFWYTASGSVATPATYADLHAIAEGVQSFQVPDIQNLHTKIGEVLAATTVAEVQAITF